MATRSFSVTGEIMPLNDSQQSSDDVYELQTLVMVQAASRSGNNTVGIDLSEEHLAELQFSDGTIWLTDNETINDVFPELEKQQRSGSLVGQIPLHLTDRQTDRSLTTIVLTAIKLFRRKKGADIIDKGVHALAKNLENKQLSFTDDEDDALCYLQPSFILEKTEITGANEPYLLFIHGTASSTSGSFGKLYGSTEWEQLTRHYGVRILAFQHRTLTRDPFDNVEQIIKQLPNQAELHVVTHSRGGLVGDLLCRFCAVANSTDGFIEEELTYWEKNAVQHAYAQKARAIATLLTSKNIKVTKIVRVACPAAGTTLASKRLEYFFNVTLNLIGIATGQNANPIYSAFKALIGEIIKKKDDPDALPGLAAQNPDSAFIKVLNHYRDEKSIDAPLYTIAGNAKPDLSFKALMVIVTRLFFTAKNDLVVNTASMTNGAMRKNDKAMWHYDEGATVNHFNYFQNSGTRKALLIALLNQTPDIVPSGYTIFKQKLSHGQLRQAALGLEGGELILDTISGKRPVCILLPGIMGSNLTAGDKKLWLHYLALLRGDIAELTYDEKATSIIKSVSIVGTSYAKLARHLQKDYDVVTYAYDWRLGMQQQAKVFAGFINTLLQQNVSIKIIGHSMGGVLMRDLMVFENPTWQSLQKTSGFQLLFLGSPLGGSFRIPYVLFGQDAIIKKLSKLDLKHSAKDLAGIFSGFPGLLCLLPLQKLGEYDFAESNTWQLMQKLQGDPEWPIPNAAALEDFKTYRNSIFTLQNNISLSKAAYIAGRDKQTPHSFAISKETVIDKDGNSSEIERIRYLMTAEGDQSVTWETGIPQAMIDLKQVYYTNTSHGSLANDPKLFAAIDDILKEGKTNELSMEKPAIRGEKIQGAIDPDNFDLSEEGIENTLLALGEMNEAEVQPLISPLKIKVSHGDIQYATYPVLAGHFINDGLFSVERAIDWHLGGELNRRMQLGLYPGAIGSFDLLLLYDKKKSFKGALIVGLGETGKLNSFQLSTSVEKGVLKYLTVYNADKTRVNFKTGVIGISAPAIGSGYGGLSIESSLRGIITGIQRANAATRTVYGNDALLVEEIEFIEIYNDKVLDYMYSLSKLNETPDSGLSFRLQEKRISTLKGNRQRIPIDDTKDWWTRIKAELIVKKFNEEEGIKTGISYTMSTNTAREEKANIYINIEILTSLLDDASKSNRWNEDLARTIYEMLIPNEFKEYLNKQHNILWLVDDNTAAWPWELLKHAQKGSKPLSVSCGMMRQLSTPNYRQVVSNVATNTALIVGDPLLKGSYPQLSGALDEGRLVNSLCQNNQYITNELLNKGASDILVALFSKEYKILHLAGHGVFETDINKPSGMLIGKDAVLTPGVIQQMSRVPELVFLNCCHLGAIDPASEALTQSRYKLAANLGTQLISIGVKAVVVAGWAVDDETALRFAETFYKQLFAGDRFGDAVQKARNAAYNYGGTTNNTWGAYQAYGDPFYLLDTEKHVPYGSKDFKFVVESQVEMELHNLLSRQNTGGYKRKQITEPLENILKQADADNLLSPKALEIAAQLYTKLGEYHEAINYYQKFLGNNKANFEVRSLEQYVNVRAKHAVEEFEKIKDKSKTADATLQYLDLLISDINRLLQIAPNGERFSLLASTQKRKVLLAKSEERNALIAASIASYGQARQYCQPGALYYPMFNQYAMMMMLTVRKAAEWGDHGTPAKDIAIQQMSDELQYCIQQAERYDDYWNMIAEPTLKLGLHMIDPDTHFTIEEIKHAYDKVWTNAGTAGDVKTEMEALGFLHRTLAETKTKAVKKITDGLKILVNYAAAVYQEKLKGEND